jgi:hypothetical protein
MWFLGVDWGEAHHDLCLLDQDGSVLAARRIADGWPGWGNCTRWWPPMLRIQPRLRWGLRPTGDCWSGRCWRLATRCTRSTRRWWAATAAGTGSRGPSLTAGTPRCWLIWSHRPAQPPPGRRRQPAGGGGQGASPGPSESDLGAAAARQRVAQRTAGVLPRCPGSARRPARRAGGLGRAGAGAQPRAGPPAGPGLRYGVHWSARVATATCRRGWWRSTMR